MQQKVRQVHGLNVPRQLVHDVMYQLDPEALENRMPGKRKKQVKGHFVSCCPDWVHSLDGHDKLMGYRNNIFPIAIYGCIDTASRKILWIKVWVSNSNPSLPAKWYLQYLNTTKRIADYIRVDCGTEVGDLTTIHAFLKRKDFDHPENTVCFGPSTSNQVHLYVLPK